MLYEDFIQKLNEINSNIVVVEKFENVKTDEKIQVQCKICGYVWKTSPQMLLYYKTGCIQCFNKNKRGKSRTMTHEQYVEKLSSVNPNITTVGTYIDTKHKIKVRCEVCGNEWDSMPRDLLKGHGCRECAYRHISNNKTKTHDEFVQKMLIINPNIEIIGEYVSSKEKIKWICKLCGQTHFTTPNALIQGQGCNQCSRNSALWKTKDKLIQQLDNKNTDWVIIGEYYRNTTPIKCRCKTCGYEDEIAPKSLLQGKRCPCCTNKIVIKGKNDIATTHPHLVKYMLNSEYAYTHCALSSKKIAVKCPDCGYEKEHTIRYLLKYGFSCPQCSDKISYPNKFSRALLNQLPINNLIYEYCPEWAGRKKYDNYFEYQGQAYILEMDGGWHYEFNNLSGQTAEDTLQKDRIKDNLAEEHNIIVIRIDSKKSEMEYIKNNILQSDLAVILDLSYVDWNKCNLNAQSSLVKKICDRYMELNNQFVSLYQSEISILHNEFNLSTRLIGRYLSKGASLGMCDYSPSKARHAHSIRWSKMAHKPVNVYDDTYYLINTYNNIIECVDMLNHTQKYNLTNMNVLKSCVLEQQDTSGLYFKFVS